MATLCLDVASYGERGSHLSIALLFIGYDSDPAD